MKSVNMNSLPLGIALLLGLGLVGPTWASGPAHERNHEEHHADGSNASLHLDVGADGSLLATVTLDADSDVRDFALDSATDLFGPPIEIAPGVFEAASLGSEGACHEVVADVLVAEREHVADEHSVGHRRAQARVGYGDDTQHEGEAQEESRSFSLSASVCIAVSAPAPPQAPLPPGGLFLIDPISGQPL